VIHNSTARKKKKQLMLDESCQTDRLDEGGSTFRSGKKKKMRHGEHSH
jgi:hypothetical protein